MKYPFTAIRMAVIKKTTNNKCWRRCGEKGTLVYYCNVNWSSQYGKEYGEFSKKLKIELPCALLCSVTQPCPTLCNLMGCSPPGLLCLWGFSRQEYWSGLPWSSPGDLLNPGIGSRSPTLQVGSLLSEPPGKPIWSSTSTSGYFPQENKNTNSKRHTHAYVHCSVIYNSQDMEAAYVPRQMNG